MASDSRCVLTICIIWDRYARKQRDKAGYLLKVDTLWLLYGIQSIVSLGIGHDVRDLTRRVFQTVAIELTQFK